MNTLLRIWTGISPELVGVGSVMLRVLLIILGAWLLLHFSRLFIEKSFSLSMRADPGQPDPRMQTLRSLAQSVVRYLIYFIAALMVLDDLGVRTSSLLASAGIVGLAVGFGAQNLVRDVISGFFIVFDHQYRVGDYVNVAGCTGIVEEVGMRMTRLRDFGGEVHYIPNGEIKLVTNYSRGSRAAVVNVVVPYEEDLEQVLALIERSLDGLAEQLPAITEGPKVLGVTEMDASGLTIRVLARTLPLEKEPVERAIRRQLHQSFSGGKIGAPYLHRVVIGERQTRREEHESSE